MEIIEVKEKNLLVQMSVEEMQEIMEGRAWRPSSFRQTTPVDRLLSLRVADKSVKAKRRRDRIADRIGDDFNGNTGLKRGRRK